MSIILKCYWDRTVWIWHVLFIWFLFVG